MKHIDELRAENERLKDLPGGKRLYSQLKLINKLRAKVAEACCEKSD